MHDFMSANIMWDLLRGVFLLLDFVFYSLLGWLYQILFRICTLDFFSNEFVSELYGRVQLILGVFMLFKVAISVIQGIINPASFTDKKSGFSTIISRILFSLVLLVTLSPLNIPNASNEFEIQINNNGLLFGTLYSFQNRILSNNTIGKLILGKNAGDENLDFKDKNDKLKKSSNMFASTILKSFLRYNLKDGADDDSVMENRVCETDPDIAKIYDSFDSRPGQLLALANVSCTSQQSDPLSIIKDKFNRLGGTDVYVFAYMPFISTIAGALCCFIFLGEIIDIVIRTFKLIFLRLIAPIPVISYVDPKSSKDGAFASWMKTLTSTYISLFVHLAVLYFVIFLIQDLIINPFFIKESGVIGAITMVIVIIGLIYFIRVAPKFFNEALGLKSGAGSGIGLASLLGGSARLFGGGGISGFLGGAALGANTVIDNYNSEKPKPVSAGSIYSKNADFMAQLRTGDKNSRAGVGGKFDAWSDFRAREHVARKSGFGMKDVADAKYASDIAASDMADKKAKYELAGKDYERGVISRDDFLKAYNEYEDAVVSSQKLEKASDAIAKAHDTIVPSRLIDERKEGSYRAAREVDTKAYTDPTTGVTYKRAVDRNGNFTTNNKDRIYNKKSKGKSTFDDSTAWKPKP